MKELNLIGIAIVVVSTLIAVSSIFGVFLEDRTNFQSNIANASPANSTNRIYVFSFSNVTGNDKVTFGSLSEAGSTFTSKINLLNRTLPNSTDVELSSSNQDQDIVISWAERSATLDDVASTNYPDNGVTLGIILFRPSNETINSTD